MAQPPPYTPETDFITYQAQAAWFPGQQLDVEFDAIDTSIAAIEHNLAEIQRDDGALANGVVGFPQLSTTLVTALAAIGVSVPVSTVLTQPNIWLALQTFNLGILSKTVITNTMLEFYGGVADGTTDNTAALTALVAAFVGKPVVITLNAGTYNFASTQSVTLATGQSLTIKGRGQENTILKFLSAGFSIILTDLTNTCHFSDLTMVTQSNSGTTAIGVNIQQNTGTNAHGYTLPSDFTNITFRGSDGFGVTNFWYIAVQLNEVAYTGFNNCNFYGPNLAAFSTSGLGVVLNGTAAFPPVQFNFVACSFNLLQAGVYYGNYVQGASLSECNFTGCNYGVYVPATLNALDELIVSGCQFNCATNGVFIGSQLPNTMISSCLFIVPANAQGIYLAVTGVTTIVGNTFNGSTGTPANNIGIVSGGFIAPSVILGNNIVFMATGVFLMGTSQSVKVQSMVFAANTSNVVDSGTNNTVGVAASELPAFTGEVTTSAGSVATTINKAITPTWSGLHTFTADLALGASGGGKTTLSPAASASNFTLTLPAATDTVALLAAVQTLTSKTLTSPTLTTPTISGAIASSATYQFKVGASSILDYGVTTAATWTFPAPLICASSFICGLVLTVAGLPSAVGLRGAILQVSDGTGGLATGANIVGGGSTPYLVWSNNTNWTVIGK